MKTSLEETENYKLNIFDNSRNKKFGQFIACDQKVPERRQSMSSIVENIKNLKKLMLENRRSRGRQTVGEFDWFLVNTLDLRSALKKQYNERFFEYVFSYRQVNNQQIGGEKTNRE